MSAELRAVLGARLSAVHARGRAAETLLGVALDALAPYASEYLAPADYERLCYLVGGAVGAATGVAVTTLADDLALALAAADPDLLSRVEGLSRSIRVTTE